MGNQWQDVALICEPDAKNPPSAPTKFATMTRAAISIMVACLLVIAVALPILHFREDAPDEDRGYVQTGRVFYRHVSPGKEPLRDQPPVAMSSPMDTKEAFEQVLVKVMGLKEDPEEFVQDAADDEEDELTGLLETVGEDPADPDAVAFLLPLRGRVGGLGIKYGRRMKQIIEQLSAEGAEGEDTAGISSVLVRDSQADADIARKLTSHFYEVHGTTRYFGYLSDDEALEVAHWARSKAPGTRFVTPTATTTYLQSAKNIASVQPTAQMLAAAVADLLLSLQVPKPIIVAQASLHTDSFIALLRSSGVRPAHMLHYFANTNVTRLVQRLGDKLAGTPVPILLLGDSKSVSLVEQADLLFPATWILPFPTQFDDKIIMRQSELLTFIYRAFDDKPGSFLKEESMLDPTESIISAAKDLLTGKRRSWYGSYVVAVSVPVSSAKKNVRVLGSTDGWHPLIQYDLMKTTLKRRVYQQLMISPDLVKPLASGNSCRLILTYLEELTGRKRVEEILLTGAFPAVIIPTDRGAQVHVDCPQQHADLRCTAQKDTWEPVKCQGTLQGQHQYMSSCGSDVSITIPTLKGCLVSKSLECHSPSSVGCLFSDLCSSVTHVKPLTDCMGKHFDQDS
ncbi:uncharacterized protein LOC125035278 [Penaeus chinensis]|uniref:uncharacterized protein LOC125035278 n=1 Tax=Penaeus chinensis TaxID=139456 RepID=UPI001FB73E23|nr:uncharacterized protein LOC125035278 [Penaeus chinensis]